MYFNLCFFKNKNIILYKSQDNFKIQKEVNIDVLYIILISYSDFLNCSYNYPLIPLFHKRKKLRHLSKACLFVYSFFVIVQLFLSKWKKSFISYSFCIFLFSHCLRWLPLWLLWLDCVTLLCISCVIFNPVLSVLSSIVCLDLASS